MAPLICAPKATANPYERKQIATRVRVLMESMCFEHSESIQNSMYAAHDIGYIREPHTHERTHANRPQSAIARTLIICMFSMFEGGEVEVTG